MGLQGSGGTIAEGRERTRVVIRAVDVRRVVVEFGGTLFVENTRVKWVKIVIVYSGKVRISMLEVGV